MGFWVLVQVCVNIFTFAGLTYLAIKLRRPPQDDPRLSRGLQLLQSKISILEDLSDRSDIQASQLQALIQQKSKELEKQMSEAEKTIAKIQQSTQKSLQVAQIFQERIPHKEIIERQNTALYVKAAKMAHAGKSAEEITAEIPLSHAEVDLIVKMNKDQLQFSEEDLPDWANPPTTDSSLSGTAFTHQANPNAESLRTVQVEQRPFVREPTGLARIGAQFREALTKEQPIALDSTVTSASRKNASIEPMTFPQAHRTSR